MASGKSTVGCQLADLLGADFVDLDRAIEAETGSSIPDLFSRGEHVFRDAEYQALARIVATYSSRKTVVATGGGTVCDARNIDAMKQVGVLVYLQTTPAVLLQRLLKAGEIAQRPLFSSTNLLTAERIEALLAHRQPHYARADWTVDSNAPIQVVAERIATWYNKFNMGEG